MRRFLEPCRALIAACLLCLLASCRSEEPPRLREEVFRERLELPRLYFTAETRKRVRAPAGKGVFVHEESGEICWPALVCNAPDCPGRTADGKPFVFIAPDPCICIKPDGTLGYDPARASLDKNPSGACPECLKIRNLSTETDQQRRRYIEWVRPYVLPETARRLKELEEEQQRRREQLQQRKQRKP